MAEQKVYTNAEINAALRKALDEKGEDYVYEHWSGSCDYARKGEPSCIVGHVLHALDPEMFEDVASHELDPGSGDLTFDAVAADLELPFDSDQITALRNVQAIQDLGRPWGDSVAAGWIAYLGEQL